LSKPGQWAVLGLYFLFLSSAAVWLMYRIAGHNREEQAIEALRSRGSLYSSYAYYDGPQWLRPIVVGYGEIKWFQRVSTLSVSAEADPEVWRQVARLKYVHQMWVRFDGGDQELREVMKGLRGCQAQRVLLGLYESRITDDGLAHLRGANQVVSVDFSHTQVTDAGLEHLAALPSLEFLGAAGSKVTMQGRSTLQNRRPRLRWLN
jgi:hypothetical protein